jgi:transcription initiation factor IIE alpha subunit
MPVRSTSRQAYYDIIEELPTRQSEVYKALYYLGHACNLDIADYLELPINSITPRMNELVRDGHVIEVGKRLSRTGRKSIFWTVKPVEEVMQDIEHALCEPVLPTPVNDRG